MFGEVALGVEMEKFDHIFDARKHKAKVKSDTDLSAEDLKAIIDDYKKLVQKDTKKPFPQDTQDQLAMSRDAVFRSWWTPKASYYRRMEKISDDIGTAANVQAMVFGNLGDTSATGVGFTRDPGHRRKDLLWRVPRQRAGRRCGRRHPHAGAPFGSRKDHARGVPAAPPDHGEPGKALPRHAGLRVHHRRRQAVHAANPQRQAHRSGSRSRGRRDGGGRPDRQEGSRDARGAQATGSAAASGLRHAFAEDPDPGRHRYLSVSRSRRRPRCFHRGRRR